MYSYSMKQERFETYVLEHKESGSYIEVVPEEDVLLADMYIVVRMCCT